MLSKVGSKFLTTVVTLLMGISYVHATMPMKGEYGSAITKRFATFASKKFKKTSDADGAVNIDFND